MARKGDIKQVLREALPHGHVTTRQALRDAGLTVYQIDNLLKAKNILTVAPGVYRTPDTNVTWECVLASLQKLPLEVSAGGLTSLAISGLQHYIAFSDTEQITLFYQQKPPAWLHTILPSVQINIRNRAKLLDPHSHLETLYWSVTTARQPSVSFVASRPELGLLESLLDVPESVSFEHVDFLMEGLSTLSPKRLHTALTHCKSVKVKRLFFWLAQRHQHSWAKRLDAGNYHLGAGKRVLAKPGKLDKTWLITVPEQMYP